MVSGAICVICASVVATQLAQTSQRYLSLLAAIPLLVVWLCFKILLFGMDTTPEDNSKAEADTEERYRLILGVIAGIGAVTGPTIKGLLLSVNRSSTRGTVFGIQTLTDDLGKGCAPIIISYAMTTIGKAAAISYAMDCFVVSSVFIVMTFWTIENDFIIDQKEIERGDLSPLTGSPSSPSFGTTGGSPGSPLNDRTSLTAYGGQGQGGMKKDDLL